jgi:glycosyltransferase involved in cell wall biosynthesis
MHQYNEVAFKEMSTLRDATKPLVSVGIPTYNGSNSVVGAVTSVLMQNYENIEIIISDDGSTDDTHEKCVRLTERNSCIRYYRQPVNIGLVANFDFVRKHAAGDLFMWVAHDDTLEPGIILRYVDFLTANPDYSLVSGQIRYLGKSEEVFYEKDFSLEQQSPNLRVLFYYVSVVHGAMYYGLLRREIAQSIPLRNRIGDDWHYVASLAYLGRIKNLDCVGYNKKLGGTSKSFKHYARVIGASRFAANFPRVAIAVDAFKEILLHSPVYRAQPALRRFVLAILCCAGIIFKYYVIEFPFVVGGKIKRWLISAAGKR